MLYIYQLELSEETWEDRQLISLTSSAPDNSYLGAWSHGYERELTIHSIEANVLCFDLFYYRLAFFEKQTAIIGDDGIARFTATDNANENWTIYGMIAFGDSVTVYITRSNHRYVDADLTEYSRE